MPTAPESDVDENEEGYEEPDAEEPVHVT